MSGDDDKLRVDIQLPASWKRGAADVWKLISGPAVGALAALQQRTLLWQLNNAAEMLDIVKGLTESRNIELGPISPKFLIPFLEKAGLEHNGAENLRELWARLLVAESVAPKALNLLFLDILSNITAAEIRLIELLAKAHQFDSDGSIIEDYPGTNISEIVMTYRFNELMNVYISKEKPFLFEESFNSLIDENTPNGVLKGLPTLLCVPILGPGNGFFGGVTSEYSVAKKFKDSIIVLLRLGVLAHRTVYSDVITSEIKHRLEWVELSDMGIKFFNACGALPRDGHPGGER